MPDKFLTEDGWKPLVAKFKLKDKELQKALFMYEAQLDDDFEFRLKYLGKIGTLAANLKKDKDVSGNAEVVKYLTNVLGAIEVEKRDIAKAKAVAAKAPKKAEEAGSGKEDEEEEEAGDYQAKLFAAFQKLKGSKDVVYEFIVCDAKPFCGVMIAKKITPKHREELSKVTGSKRFLPPGTCSFTQGKFSFSTEKPAPGLAKKLQLSIKNFTGKKLPIAVGTETADDEDEQAGGAATAVGAEAATSGSSAGAAQPGQPEGSGHNAPAPGGEPVAPKDAPANIKGPLALSGSVGRGGKNKLEEVQAVQTALNGRAKAGLPVDGKCGAKTIAAIMAFQKTLGFVHPDGLIEPGKKTEQGLNGATVNLSEAEKAHKGAGDVAAATSDVAATGSKGAAHPADAGGAFAAEAKAGKEIADRDKKTLQSCSGWVKRITDMLGGVTDAGAASEGTKIKELIRKKVVENHNGPVTHVKEAVARLATQPEAETAEEVKQAVAEATKGFKELDDLTDDAMAWTTMNSHPRAAASEPRSPEAERKAI